MSEEEKTYGEKIVEMLCDGMKVKDIQKDLQISKAHLETAFDSLRHKARLPYYKVTYRARKDDILSNVKKWNAHKKLLDELNQKYRDTLVEFDF